MKQVIYTSCAAGKSLDGAAGFQIRAASAGIGPELGSCAALSHMGYGLPSHVHPLSHSPSSMPVRFAFLKLPDLGPVLCHSVSAGLDPTTHRSGNFFSHLLLDLPPSFTADAAIRTWGSDTWRRTDDSFDTTLPDIEEIHSSAEFSNENLRQFLATAENQNLFRFVLAAFVATRTDWRIFVAAPAGDVAFCLYGLTRVCPKTCLGELTFSTYENRPLSCPARLVGSWGEESGDVDMPSACYEGKAIGFNSYTGRASHVALEGEFVDCAMKAMITGDQRRLDQVRAVCEECGIDRPALLNLVCRAESGSVLSQADLLQLLACPRYLKHLLANPSNGHELLARSLEDTEMTAILVGQVIPALKNEGAALDILQNSAKHAALDAIVCGRLSRIRVLVEHILPVAFDCSIHAALTTLLNSVANPCAVPWQTRAYLLTRMAVDPNCGPQSDPCARWLSYEPSELPTICALPLANAWKTQACLNCLQHFGPTEALVETLSRHSEILLDVLRHVAGDEKLAQNLPGLARELLNKSNSPSDMLDKLIRCRSQLNRQLTSAFLMAAAQNGRVNLLRLSSQFGPDLLETLDDGPLETLLARLFESPLPTLFCDRPVMTLLRAARERNFTDEIRTELEAILVIWSFIDRPLLCEDSLSRVATGLKTLHSTADSNLVVQKAVEFLVSEHDSPACGRAVERLLRTLGPVSSGGIPGLYYSMLWLLQSRKEFWKRPYLICGLVAAGLRGRESLELPPQTATMAEHARDLAVRVARRSPRRVFALIDRLSRSWPAEARLRWNLIARYVRPPSRWTRLFRSWKKSVGALLLVVSVTASTIQLVWQRVQVGARLAQDRPTTGATPATNDPHVRENEDDKSQP